MGYALEFGRFLSDTYRSRWLLYELTRNDFVADYLGSYLGIIWAVIQPITTIGVLWFVFQVGFRVQPVANVPFIIWLMAGMVPWFFVSDCLSKTANSVVEKGFLVSKVSFRASILPVVKILSSLIVHLFFIGILLIIVVCYGYKPNLHYLQIIYYLVASVMLVMGISWITAALAVFIRDVGHLTNVALQFLFWMTPIFWSPEIIPERYRIYLKLNPMYYLVEGYRDCLIRNLWMWDSFNITAYFWCVTLILFAIGAVVFRRLRPHFGDML